MYRLYSVGRILMLRQLSNVFIQAFATWKGRVGGVQSLFTTIHISITADLHSGLVQTVFLNESSTRPDAFSRVSFKTSPGPAEPSCKQYCTTLSTFSSNVFSASSGTLQSLSILSTSLLACTTSAASRAFTISRGNASKHNASRPALVADILVNLQPNNFGLP